MNCDYIFLYSSAMLLFLLNHVHALFVNPFCTQYKYIYRFIQIVLTLTLSGLEAILNRSHYAVWQSSRKSIISLDLMKSRGKTGSSKTSKECNKLKLVIHSNMLWHSQRQIQGKIQETLKYFIALMSFCNCTCILDEINFDAECKL